MFLVGDGLGCDVVKVNDGIWLIVKKCGHFFSGFDRQCFKGCLDCCFLPSNRNEHATIIAVVYYHFNLEVASVLEKISVLGLEGFAAVLKGERGGHFVSPYTLI